MAPEAVVEMGPVVRLAESTGGSVAAIRASRLPVASTSLWTRSPLSSVDPGDVPLRLHFDVKAALGFDHAVIVGHRTRVVRATRVGDRIGCHQELRSVGPERRTPLGPGRGWEVDLVLIDADGQVVQVETFRALGYSPSPRAGRRPDVAGAATVSRSVPCRSSLTDRSIARAAAGLRVWAPVHHDPVAARRSGLPGVIACTQHLVSLVEQSVVVAAAPGAVIVDLDLRMRRPLGSGPAPEISVRPAVATRPGASRRDLEVQVHQRGQLCCTASVTLGSGASVTLG